MAGLAALGAYAVIAVKTKNANKLKEQAKIEAERLKEAAAKELKEAEAKLKTAVEEYSFAKVVSCSPFVKRLSDSTLGLQTIFGFEHYCKKMPDSEFKNFLPQVDSALKYLNFDEAGKFKLPKPLAESGESDYLGWSLEKILAEETKNCQKFIKEKMESVSKFPIKRQTPEESYLDILNERINTYQNFTEIFKNKCKSLAFKYQWKEALEEIAPHLNEIKKLFPYDETNINPFAGNVLSENVQKIKDILLKKAGLEFKFYEDFKKGSPEHGIIFEINHSK